LEIALLVDTHCHLDLHHFDTDRDAVLERARAAGVGRILIPGIDLAQNRRAVALAEKYSQLRVAVGVHPNDTPDFGARELGALRALAQHPQVDAIGEIGIDLYWKAVPLEQQQHAFRMHLELAADLNKPVIIHDREAHAEVMAILREQAPPAGGVLHAFSGDAAMAAEAMQLGFYLGVDGPLTYKKSDALRAIVATVPLDRILIETDAPYLTPDAPPQAKRGTRNEPANVRHVAQKLAEVRGLSVDAVAEATTANARRLFRWESVALK
jgi:TatD DNase family protein